MDVGATPPLRPEDAPRRLAEVVLAAAIRSSADAVYLDPGEDGTYRLSFERGQHEIGSSSLDALLGAATVARLAYVAGLDLATHHATSAIIPVRSGDRFADVVVTIRHGAGLRADLAVIRRGGAVARKDLGHPSTVAIGDVIGNYRLVELLGEGGMGTVFRAEHAVLGRAYALKVLRPKVIERDPSAAERFVREARAAARVRHPNIVDVFDVNYLSDGRPYLVMELVDGQALADLIEVAPLDVGAVIAIGKQLAGALAAVHERGVIHADVTPSNILVVSTDPIEVKLVDFGLAVIAGEGVDTEDSDFVLGTPAYISPEQLRGLPATDRSDQYSLGVVLFEALAGHPPFVDPDVAKLVRKHLTAPVPVPRSPAGPIPPKLVDLITTCLQKSPQVRFTGMRAVVAALDEIGQISDRTGWRRWLPT